MGSWHFSPYDYYLRHPVEPYLRENAVYLLCRLLNIETHQFLRGESYVVKPWMRFKIHFFFRRLRFGEPLEYILGEKIFRSLFFRVRRGVLIPRIETEELVEKTLEYVKNLPSQRLRLLDVGSGCGNVGISLKRELSEASVTAIDKNSLAVRLTQKNARALLEKGSDFGAKRVDVKVHVPISKYNGIITNPPYVREDERAFMGEEVLKYEPEDALFSGPEGLDVVKILMRCLPVLLEAGGFLFLECGFTQAKTIGNLLEKLFREVCIEKDFFGKERFVLAKDYQPELP